MSLAQNYRTPFSKSFRSHILHKSAGLPAFLLDVFNGVVVPFFFGVLMVDLLETDGNGGRENDDTLDVAAG